MISLLLHCIKSLRLYWTLFVLAFYLVFSHLHCFLPPSSRSLALTFFWVAPFLVSFPTCFPNLVAFVWLYSWFLPSAFYLAYSLLWVSCYSILCLCFLTFFRGSWFYLLALSWIYDLNFLISPIICFSSLQFRKILSHPRSLGKVKTPY